MARQHRKEMDSNLETDRKYRGCKFANNYINRMSYKRFATRQAIRSHYPKFQRNRAYTLGYYPTERTLLPTHRAVDSVNSSENPILFHLADCEDIKAVKWYIDGKESKNYIRLETGEHSIQAEITRSDGNKEYIMQYITIQ